MKPAQAVRLVLVVVLGFCVATGDFTTTAPTTTEKEPTNMTTVTPSTIAAATTDMTTGANRTTSGTGSTLATSATMTTNITTAPSVTSAVTSPNTTANLTTAPATSLSQSTPPQTNKWEVQGKDGLCQSMQFYANVTVPYYNTSDSLDSVTVSVPSSSSANGTCLMEEREFVLAFIPDAGNQTWTLQFVFISNSSTYQLASLSVQFSFDDVLFHPKEQGQQRSTYISMDSPLAGLTAPLGCPYQRDTLSFQSKDKQQFRVDLTDLKLQPFADSPKEPKECQPRIRNPPSNLWMSVGIAFIVMFAVLLLAFALYCFHVKKHKQQSGDTYNLMENY